MPCLNDVKWYIFEHGWLVITSDRGRWSRACSSSEAQRQGRYVVMMMSAALTFNVNRQYDLDAHLPLTPALTLGDLNIFWRLCISFTSYCIVLSCEADCLRSALFATYSDLEIAGQPKTKELAGLWYRFRDCSLDSLGAWNQYQTCKRSPIVMNYPYQRTARRISVTTLFFHRETSPDTCFSVCFVARTSCLASWLSHSFLPACSFFPAVEAIC